MPDVDYIPIFSDNYVWVIRSPVNKQSVVIVDPGHGDAVIAWLEQRDLIPAAILITHHHYDHVDGVPAILERYSATNPIPVFGPARETIGCVTCPVAEGDQVTVSQAALTFQVIDLPGHTKGHIAYMLDNALFSGDTLFSAGCGRIFDGSAIELYNSLQKLTALADETIVYATHEYTLNNLTFAAVIEPGNCDITAYANQVKERRQANVPSLPTTIGREKRINPFLRTNQATVRQTVVAMSSDIAQDEQDEVAVFTALRRLKDNF